MRDEDFVVVIWSNSSSDGGRPFETMMKHGSRLPVAWNLGYLQGKYAAALPSAYLVLDEADLRSWMSPPLSGSVTRDKPLLLPLNLARSVLGWQEFDFWDD